MFADVGAPLARRIKGFISARPHFHGRFPMLRERGASLQPDQSVTSSKCVWWASHWLDSETAAADVGKWVAAEEHQVGVALINLERDLSSVVRIAELHMRDSILVPLKVGECMVEHCRADPP
jgi:hypothetical protein